MSWCRGMQAGPPQLSPLCYLHQHSHFIWVPLWERIHRGWHTALQPNVSALKYSNPRIPSLNLLIKSFYSSCSLSYLPSSHSCYNECREGQCSGSPRFECECALGWTSDPATLVLSGVECDVDCGCNFHSTCITAPGICDECQGQILIKGL